jgi:hypothetical protein
VTHHGAVFAEGPLPTLIAAVEVFGFHLATLDLRQNSDVHERVVAELLRVAGVCPDYGALDEAGRLARDVIAPLNAVGDRTGSRLENGVVRTPPGWQEAYRAFVEGGWNSLPCEPEHGGQGMPWALATVVQEMVQAANLSFGLCPLLTAGAIDLLLDAVARIRPRTSFRLLVVAGGDFAPFREQVRRLGLEDRVIVRENVSWIEDYAAACDFGLITSESESFCLSILEAMTFARPSIATAVGGIPEVIEDGRSGLLVPFGDADGLARAAERLIADPRLRQRLGRAAQARAKSHFSAERIVPTYIELYRKLVARR